MRKLQYILGATFGLVVFFLLFSPGKAAAACDTSNWGITSGSSSADAGLIVHTQLSNGTEVNVNYTLVNTSTASPNTSYTYSIWYAAGGTNSTSGSSPYHSLARTTGSTYYTSSSGTTASCTGYDVYAYGTSGSNGNRYALDCHGISSSGTYSTSTTYFQIQSVANPSGHPYGSWSGDNTSFTVTNGSTRTITLTWTDDTSTFSGRIANLSGVGVPGVGIYVGTVTNGTTASDTTDANGYWAVTVPKGAQRNIYIVKNSSGLYVVPSGYNNNPDALNQVAEHVGQDYYYNQSGGVNCYHDTSPPAYCDGYTTPPYSAANTSYDWDHSIDNNYNFRLFRNVTVSGRVYNSATNTGYANVTIATCGSNPTDVTDANGNWSIVLRETGRFCIRPSTDTTGATAFSPGAGFTQKAVNNQVDNSNAATYEYQVAGVNCYHDTSPPLGCNGYGTSPYSTTPSTYDWDRSNVANAAPYSDTGYNVAYIQSPDSSPSMTIGPSDCSAKTFTVAVNDADGSPAGSISYSVDGGPTTTVTTAPPMTTSGTKTTYVIDMSSYNQYVTHTISASSPGKIPSGATPATPATGSGTYEKSGGGSCQTPIGFTVTPGGSVVNLPDDEDPDSFDFSATLTTTGSPNTFPVVVTRTYYYYKYPDMTTQLSLAPNTTVATTANISPVPVSPYNINPAISFTYGDKICTTVSVSPAAGTMDSSGNVLSVTTASSSKEECDYVGNKPYVRVYGGDVFAGGIFTSSGTCTGAVPGALKGETSAFKGAAGTQLAVYALGAVSNFNSAMLRSTLPISPNGLTYANTAGAGNFTSSNCVDNYFDDTQFKSGDPKRHDVTVNTLNTDSLANEEQTIITTPQVVISQTTARNFRHTVYVNGDAVITSNIAYAGSNPTWSGITSTPYFTLVVKGNIYITENVTQLNGVFIALPSSGVKGKIFTCRASGTGAQLVTNDMQNHCGSQLIVNGSFIAQQLVLQRTFSSLRQGLPTESATTTKAAEIFQGSPEMQIGMPVFKTDPGVYDSVRSLPPVF